MKIGLVRRGYSPSGGAEKYLQRFGEALAAAGHEAKLFCSFDWPEAGWRFGPVTRVSGSTPGSFAAAFKQAGERSGCDCLLSLERVHACDIFRAGDGLHRVWLEKRAAFEPKWKSLARFANRKHGEILGLEERLLGSGGAGRVIVNSKMVKNEILSHFAYPAGKISVVYNGIPHRSFHRRPGMRQRLRDSLAVKKDELLALFVGSGWERKGLRHAVNAVSQARREHPVRLVVAGRGNPRAYRRKGVDFLGQVEDVQSWLDAADVFILPTWYDPFSNACLEALAAGLPVITTSSNGFSEIIEPGLHGNVINDPVHADLLAQALLFWVPEERRVQAAAANAELAATFSIEANVAETLHLVEAAVADRTC